MCNHIQMIDVPFEYENRLKDVETWFLVHEKEHIMEFAKACLRDKMVFSLEIYTASTLIEKCYSILSDDAKQYLNPVGFISKWIEERTADSYNVGVIECFGDNGAYFKTLDSFTDMQTQELLSKLSYECVWIVSIMKEGKAII